MVSIEPVPTHGKHNNHKQSQLFWNMDSGQLCLCELARTMHTEELQPASTDQLHCALHHVVWAELRCCADADLHVQEGAAVDVGNRYSTLSGHVWAECGPCVAFVLCKEGWGCQKHDVEHVTILLVLWISIFGLVVWLCGVVVGGVVFLWSSAPFSGFLVAWLMGASWLLG